ncbi:LexA family protein [Streptomyces sp. NPDC127108]|uniref:LexA family protein n=1 Tax=Streptomyces sp. NPDC127108 TaxID=3345361 RepID=UPI00364306ED
MTLSDRQLRIMRSAREWIAEYGEAPTVRELARAVGLASTSSVHYQLARLREQGIAVETRGRRSARCPYCGH